MALRPMYTVGISEQSKELKLPLVIINSDNMDDSAYDDFACIVALCTYESNNKNRIINTL